MATEPTARVENLTGTRMLAGVIDVLVLTVVFVLMGIAFGDVGENQGPSGSTQWGVSLENGPFLAYLVLVFLYHALLEGLTGATLGKKLLRLRVVKENGDALDWKSAVLRNVVRYIDFLPVLYLVGVVTIAVSSRKQRLGDLVAHTVVVRAGSALTTNA